jgi:hypothetical protein
LPERSSKIVGLGADAELELFDIARWCERVALEDSERSGQNFLNPFPIHSGF